MSEPPKKGLIDLDLVEKEFAKVMNDEDVFYDAPNSLSELNFRASTADSTDSYVDCDSSKQSEEEDGEEMDADTKSKIIDSIHDVFSGFYEKNLIVKMMEDYNNDADQIIEKLSDSICVGLKHDDQINEPVKTVYAMDSKNVFNKNTRRANNARLEKKLDEEELKEAIRIADEVANKHHNSSKHHYDSSRKFSINDPRSKALSAIARDDKKKAILFESDADLLRATKVVDSLDLHEWGIERGLRFVNITIQEIRKKNPQQRKLQIITGQGKNNRKGHPYMKEALFHWLNKMGIKYEIVKDNLGVVNIDLTSVQ